MQVNERINDRTSTTSTRTVENNYPVWVGGGSTTTTRTDVARVQAACTDAGISWSKQAATMTQRWLAEGFAVEVLINYAIEETALAPYPSFRYVAAIMRRLREEGLYTMRDVTRSEMQRAARRGESAF